MRPLSSHRKRGDDLAKNTDFRLVCHHFFRAARGLYHIIILTKLTILKRATDAIYKIVHAIGSEFNKNGNNNYLNFTQLFHAWLQILKRDLRGNENLRKRRNIEKY